MPGISWIWRTRFCLVLRIIFPSPIQWKNIKIAKYMLVGWPNMDSKTPAWETSGSYRLGLRYS